MAGQGWPYHIKQFTKYKITLLTTLLAICHAPYFDCQIAKSWEGAAWGNMFVIHGEGEVEEDIIGQGGPFLYKQLTKKKL